MSFGVYDKKYISTVNFLDRREIYQYVLDITREDESFVDIMEMMGRSVPTDVPSYHNFVNKERYVTVTATAVNDESAGTDGSLFDVTLSAGDYALVREGELVLCPNKKVGYLKEKKAANEVVIVAVDGSDMELEIGSVLSMFSNAAGEGSSAPADGRRYDITKNLNQVMIFKSVVKTTDIQRASKVEVEFRGQPYYFIKAQHDALMKFKGDISLAMLFSRISDENFTSNSPTLTDTTGNPIQTTKGLNQYVEDFGIDITGTNAVSLATYATLERQFAKDRCPQEYLVLLGSEGSIAHTDAFGALTNASVFSPGARLQVNGRDIDVNIDKLNLYGRTYMIKKLPILDHKNVINFTGSAGFQNRMWYIPNDQIKADVGGESQDRIRMRYLEDYGEGAIDHRYRELLLGGLAPTPTDSRSLLEIVYESRQGLEVLGPHHFAFIDLDTTSGI